jgi:hypothetical protein
MKHYIQLSLLVTILLSSSILLLAGDIEPTTAPESTNSYTIGDICDRLDTGATGTQIPFTEPTAAPGSTGCTLNDVMSKAPTEDNTNGATLTEVIIGKTFWGLRTDGTWGLQTGAAPPVPVAKTGQTTCYDAAGATISCTGTGQDGDKLAGITWPPPVLPITAMAPLPTI